MDRTGKGKGAYWYGARDGWRKGAHLDDSIGLYQVGAASYSHSRLAVGRDLVHCLPEKLEVFESARTVGIDHEEAPPAAVKHAVADSAAFSEVLLENDDADL